MEFNWNKIGIELARVIFPILISLVLGAFLFREYVAPQIYEALEEAQKTIKTLASLGGLKKAEYTGAKNIEKSVARDIIEKQIPELELVKAFVSADTWDEINETLENNPEAVIQLWQKYGHLFKGVEENQKSEFDF